MFQLNTWKTFLILAISSLVCMTPLTAKENTQTIYQTHFDQTATIEILQTTLSHYFPGLYLFPPSEWEKAEAQVGPVSFSVGSDEDEDHDPEG